MPPLGYTPLNRIPKLLSPSWPTNTAPTTFGTENVNERTPAVQMKL